MIMKLETMSDFFTARLEGYDEHMLEEVKGCREGYGKLAEALPENTGSLLDLGCGTGLELDEIFRRFPDLSVTGIDMTASMLEKLRQKALSPRLKLICGDYFSVNFGREAFDAAVSFQSLHHFKPEAKTELYRRIWEALRHGGVYLECDYMAASAEEEAFYFRENDRLRAEQGIPEGVFCHFDTPCTPEHQRRILLKAGFASCEILWKQENTTLLRAVKV